MLRLGDESHGGNSFFFLVLAYLWPLLYVRNCTSTKHLTNYTISRPVTSLPRIKTHNSSITPLLLIRYVPLVKKYLRSSVTKRKNLKEFTNRKTVDSRAIMGTINHAAAIKRLEALFADVNLEQKPIPEVHVEVEHQHDNKCDVHGIKARRGSLGNNLHTFNNAQKRHSFGSTFGVGPRRESMPALNMTMPNYYRWDFGSFWWSFVGIVPFLILKYLWKQTAPVEFRTCIYLLRKSWGFITLHTGRN